MNFLSNIEGFTRQSISPFEGKWYQKQYERSFKVDISLTTGHYPLMILLTDVGQKRAAGIALSAVQDKCYRH